MKKEIIIIAMVLMYMGYTSKGQGARSTPAQKVLFIVSNQHTYGTSQINAANHFAEIVLAYDVLDSAGIQVDFVSPEGGSVPIGYINTSSPVQKQYLYDCEFLSALYTTKKPSEIKASDYFAVYYVGGGAAMFGVPENEEIQKISMEVYEKHNGIVSAICHGTAGIVNLKTSDGKYIYQNKSVTGFPDIFERKDAEYYQQFPFSIQETISSRAGEFNYSEEGWDNYFTSDGRLITGQDPTGARSVARLILRTLVN